MKFILSATLALSISSLASDAFFKNCQSCHGNSPGKEPLVIASIQKDFMDHEFIEYLQYAKGKFSIHSSQIEDDTYNKKTKYKIIQASNLPFQTRSEITDFIFGLQDDSHACMW